MPISLMNGVYKVVKKVLVRRLVRVLGSLAEECEHAFVGDRQILDTVLMAIEVMDRIMKNGK